MSDGSGKSALSFFVFLYTLAVFGLFFYSFTQVDLGLTLTRASVFQGIQQAFQYVGYFNRPLSAALFILLAAVLFGLYMYAIRLTFKKLLSKTLFWKVILITAGILMFSYTAFSHDIFNYIFDAKIITNYQENPYTKKALDFPQDPMLSFMRWTHRVYPYGPGWLFLTVPLSFVGMNIFLLTYFLFKALMAASYIGSVYFIGRFLRRVAPEHEVPGMVLFGLNPLVITESLISSHNDIVMMFFAVLGVYLLSGKKYVFAYTAFIAAYSIKFATAAVPLYVHAGIILLLGIVLFLIARQKISIDWKNATVYLTAVMVLPVLAGTYRTNFQPWYLLYILPFAASVWSTRLVIIPIVVLSFAALLQYVPYLYLGNWDPPVPAILNASMLVAVVLSLILVLGMALRPRR